MLQTLSINNYNDYNNQHLNINAAILDHSIQNSYEVNHNVLGSMDSNRAIAYPNMISYGSTDTYTQNQNISNVIIANTLAHQTTNTQPSDYLSAYSAAHSRNSELNPSMGVHGQLYVLSSSN